MCAVGTGVQSCALPISFAAARPASSRARSSTSTAASTSQAEGVNDMLNLQDVSLLRTQCLIDGQWVGSEQTIAVTHPATGAHIAAVPRIGAAQARQATRAANRRPEQHTSALQ